MQTFIVHNRAPREFLREVGWRGFVGFQLIVGGMMLSSLLHTVFLAGLVLRLSLGGTEGLLPADLWDWLALVVLAVGYGGAIAVVVSGLLHIGALRLLPAQLLLPAYWVLHSIAAIRAAAELIRRPHFWSKTAHGLARQRVTQSGQRVLGRPARSRARLQAR